MTAIDEIHVGNSIINPKFVMTYVHKDCASKAYPMICEIKRRGKGTLFEREYINLDRRPIKDCDDKWQLITREPFKEGVLYQYKNIVVSFKDRFYIDGYFYVLDGKIVEKSREEIFSLYRITKK